jgi:predicted GNAT family acetyltransferase
MSVFVALPVYDKEHFDQLAVITPAEAPAVFFVPHKIGIPDNWQTVVERELLQMTYELAPPPAEDISDLVLLQDEHIPAMTELTSLTKPGPWLPRTIDFGHYEGIFEGGQLVAMCGQRLQPDPWTELSAVCVHPDHLGKGYAKRLIRNQLRHIAATGRKPMLHLYQDNISACGLYESVGFQTRREMIVYMLKKK